jgi:glyoxylase-like metal-dependent hydrolase (beta-lactamase superfamily II)
MTDPKSRAGISFPFAAPPEPRGWMEIADGVLWIRMPMPFVLDHINIFAIADGDGWAVIDTGLENPETITLWREFLKGPLQGKPVTRVIATHMHPDHIGTAGWLTRRFDCRLWMTRLEYMNCRVLVADTLRQAPIDAIRFCKAAGWGDEQIDDYRTKFGNYGKFIHPLPDSFKRICHGDRFFIGKNEWQVFVGTGHSPEHACFYCPELKLFLSGDQVIPGISSNVSVYPLEPDANPMQGWLETLAQVRDVVPDDVLVMPSHKTAFYGLHARIGELLEEHQRDFDKLKAALGEPKRAVDLFDSLFTTKILGSQLLHLATGECMANLNYLESLGEISRIVDDDGVAWFQRV